MQCDGYETKAIELYVRVMNWLGRVKFATLEAQRFYEWMITTAILAEIQEIPVIELNSPKPQTPTPHKSLYPGVEFRRNLTHLAR